MNTRTTADASVETVTAADLANPAVQADQLVEDVSIDGMCGVY
jgi:mycofactocin precursor